MLMSTSLQLFRRTVWEKEVATINEQKMVANNIFIKGLVA